VKFENREKIKRLNRTIIENSYLDPRAIRSVLVNSTKSSSFINIFGIKNAGTDKLKKKINKMYVKTVTVEGINEIRP
jgi:hypothetical protein